MQLKAEVFDGKKPMIILIEDQDLSFDLHPVLYQQNISMLSSPTAKNSSVSAKLTLLLNSSPIQASMPPRSPAFSRKGGQNRRDKGIDSMKSSEERSVQKSLKYTKILPRDWRNEDSEVHSEVHIIHMLGDRLQDSRETVNFRGRSKSNIKQGFLKPVINSPKPKSPGRKVLEDFTCISDRKIKAKNSHDEHYVYWKNKAYEYLNSNIKLMDEVRRLTRENEELKTAITQLQQSIKTKAETDQNRIYSQKALSRQLRNISSIYIGKIEGMEKELKRKQIIIATYDLKVTELTSRLAGDTDRVKIMNKMHQQIQTLKGQNEERQVEHLKLQSNFYESTSIFAQQNSNR